MAFNLFNTTPSPSTVIQKENDPVKYNEIRLKLCVKRSLLEETIKDTSLDQGTREDAAIDLVMLKDSMVAFGVSEIDYYAYLHTNTQATQVDQLQPVTEPKNTTMATLVEPD